MLLLCGEVGAAGLVMFSASRIALSEWQIRQSRLQGLRALVSHGRDDPDLAFAAGERLQRFLRDAGAKVIWVPFNGGHEVPFQVWRRFRELVRDLMQGGAMDSEKKLSYGIT